MFAMRAATVVFLGNMLGKISLLISYICFEVACRIIRRVSEILVFLENNIQLIRNTPQIRNPERTIEIFADWVVENIPDKIDPDLVTDGRYRDHLQEEKINADHVACGFKHLNIGCQPNWSWCFLGWDHINQLRVFLRGRHFARVVCFLGGNSIRVGDPRIGQCHLGMCQN